MSLMSRRLPLRSELAAQTALTNFVWPITFTPGDNTMNTTFAIILIIDHGIAPGS